MLKVRTVSPTVLAMLVLLLVSGLSVMAVGTADATITAVADDANATYAAVKDIAIVIFGAFVGIGIFKAVWRRFASRT